MIALNMTNEKNDSDNFKLPLGYGSNRSLHIYLMKKYPWMYYALGGILLLFAIIIWIFE